MLKPVSPPDARRLRDFLAEAHYTQEEFQRRAIQQELPRHVAGSVPYFLEQVGEPTVLNLLLRWFFLGVAAPAELSAGLIPEPLTGLMLDSGMLVCEGNLLSPAVTLTPCDQYIFAADPAAGMQTRPADVIVWPNPTTRLLHHFTIRKPFPAMLDLGTGCGIQAVLAAHHSGHVTATDLNPRAAEFTIFNARLNDVEPIECLTGDTFEPVQDRQFDLIVANPPFFVTPSGDQIYCENSMQLDGYCRRIVREAPRHLHEGGFLQMVFEWVEVRGQTWQERLRGWLEATGCDAWIFRGYARKATAYARERLQQTRAAGADPETLARWLDYYREQGVEEIHGGVLALRRRSGRNWIRIEDMPLDPGGPFGEAVWQAFANIDFLEQHVTDEQMLASRPSLSPDAQLEQQLRQVDGRWQPVGTRLHFTAGIPASLRLEPPVADFLATLDGRQSLGELAARLAQRVRADPAIVRKECVAVVRKLAECRFLLT